MGNTRLSLIIQSSLIALLTVGCRNETSPRAAEGSPAPSQESITQPLTKPEETNKQPNYESQQAAPVFGPILSSLSMKTKVPLRIPTYLATESESNPLYAILEAASPSEYEIQLAFTPDCSGGNVCHYGTIAGRNKPSRSSVPGGRAVLLRNGLTAYFTEATCGATCSDALLTWDEGGYRYTVALKAENKETLTKVAESVFAN